MLTILQVAYPLAPVGPDSSGGAEQIVSRLDEGLVARGQRSIVIACAGSRCRGRLVETAAPARLDDVAIAAARRQHGSTLERVLATTPIDVVHLHGIDFEHYLPAARPATMVTLHLPLDWYSPAALAAAVTRVCVSRAQRQTRPTLECEVIDNGVDVQTTRRCRPRHFALMLARVCPEKGLHVAIDAARAAGLPLVIGGQLFAYPAHVAYFEEAVRPRLGAGARWLGAIDLGRRRRLLAAARCLISASQAPETSSLVAMEALAVGTPVVALRAGALGELVEDGRTGWLVDDPRDLPAALRQVHLIDRETCRAAARARFDGERMVDRYLARYEELARLAAVRS